jgi:hypothetical protein
MWLLDETNSVRTEFRDFARSVRDARCAACRWRHQRQSGLMIDDAGYPAKSFQLREGRIQRAPSDFPQYVRMRSDALLQQGRSFSRNK